MHKDILMHALFTAMMMLNNTYIRTYTLIYNVHTYASLELAITQLEELHQEYIRMNLNDPYH